MRKEMPLRAYKMVLLDCALSMCIAPRAKAAVRIGEKIGPLELTYLQALHN